MAYIILAESRMKNILQSAATILQERGNQVDVSTDGNEVLELASKQYPDILVLGLLLRHKYGLDVLDELKRKLPQPLPKIVWIASIYDDTGGPAIVWEMEDMSSFLMPPVSPWQIVLSVEQLIYRRVTSIQD